MLKNYITTTFRFFWKNKSYSLINILGLSVGMSCFIMLTLFVQKEFSYDQYHNDKELMYQVYLSDTASVRSDYAAQTMAPMGPLFQESIPQVEQTVRFGKMSNKVVKVAGGGKYQVDKIYFSDEDVFDFFSIPLLTGSTSNVLGTMDDVVISRQEALRLFGNVEEAVSQVIEVVGFGSLTVSGVFEDLPDNTHLNFDYLISFENADKAMGGIFNVTGSKSVFNWGTVSAFPLYVKLNREEINLAELEGEMQKALNPHRPNDLVKLLPVADIYFSDLNKGYFGRKGERSNARMYIIIAFIILGVAIINYMNMATARHSKRAKEVGIRKTVGGHRSQIAKQFFLESLTMASISLLVAICLTEISLPALTTFIGKDLAITYDSLSTLGLLLAFTLSIGFLSGIYPSLYLSKFNPIQMLTGRAVNSKGGAIFRKILVGFQFFVCLGLIGVTTIVYSQFQYMQNIDLGLEDDQIIGVPIRDTHLRENYKIFKDKLLQNSSIASVSGVSYPVFNGNMVVYADIDGMEERQSLNYMKVEPGFLTTLGIEMNEGEKFGELDESAQNKAMFLNVAAVEKFGWESAIGKEVFGAEVNGVVNDFVFGSAKKAIEPAAMMTGTEGFEYTYIKLSGFDISKSLSYIQSAFEEFSVDYPFDFKFLDDHFAAKYENEKKLSDVFSIFSILAIFVAGLGIFGLSVFMAEQRIKEIGIRKVLGASIGHIVWVLNNSVTMIIGVVAIITLPLVYYFMSEWLTEFAFHISIDGVLLILPLLALTVIVWSILMFQSLKSATSNPIKALRTE